LSAADTSLVEIDAQVAERQGGGVRAYRSGSDRAAVDAERIGTRSRASAASMATMIRRGQAA
jgi:hypothetical protein